MNDPIGWTAWHHKAKPSTQSGYEHGNGGHAREYGRGEV